ncbi:MAG: Bug family tripartite tricarboxylate transporter substrate binding protein [Betaproteobacteria bacterium]
MKIGINAFGLIVSLLAPCCAALAQDYPAREIRSICNFAAGSGADIIVRFYSDRLAKLAGKPVVVENKPGVQGTLATDFVARSKPHGYTIMITPASSTLATAPQLSFVIAVDAAKPIKSIQELIAVLKAKPNHGFYGTGSNTAFQGLVGGEVDFISYDATWAVTQHPARIRILAATAAKRSSAIPDMPTLSELGFGEFDIAPWFGVVVPRARRGRSSSASPAGSTRSPIQTTQSSSSRARRSTHSRGRRNRWRRSSRPRPSAGAAGSR